MKILLVVNFFSLSPTLQRQIENKLECFFRHKASSANMTLNGTTLLKYKLVHSLLNNTSTNFKLNVTAFNLGRRLSLA